ncbi:MAG: hypothetical protein ACRECE_03455 [Xanthobacteraceae bacterium]
MAFQMNDIPISRPVVAEAIAGCLHKCDRALNELLIDTKGVMPESEWNVLRRGVGEILATSMFYLWAALVKQHPRFEREAFGEPAKGQQ